MIQLPSGQRVAISSERARFHATRRKLCVDGETPPGALWQLVDVLFLDDSAGAGCVSSGRYFTGFTLADRSWFARWPREDRHAFRAWVRKRPQQQEIEAARRRVMYDRLPQRIRTYPYPERLYSRLARCIAELDLPRATARQWRNTIVNLSRRGVRRDEIRWSGVLEFLNATGPERRIHREDLRRRIGFPGLSMRLSNELVRKGSYRLPFQEVACMAPEWGRGVVRRYQDPAFGYRILMTRDGIATSAWLAVAPDGRELAEPQKSPADAIALASDHAARRFGLQAPLRPSDRYGYLALHGGDDYREWLLTLPEFPESHFSPHFTERNLLLHFRTARHLDARGRPLWLIEEIQSDWHQLPVARRRMGANSDRPVPAAPFAREWVSLALKLILLHAAEEGIERIAWVPGGVQQQRFRCDRRFLAHLYDHEIPHRLSTLAAPWGGAIGTATIRTRRPWLCIRRRGEGWFVSDGDGRFATRRPRSREQALLLAQRHSRTVHLEVPVFSLPPAMRAHVLIHGLPLFGERHMPA